ncbi:hypothetical protein [Kitasatospora sp. NPDC017646]|uniref:hypothetical protein n=1 Tax=Kitasatospora sp. NPDC017646 TaxID=3364024 RepID=UPI0037A9F90A
MEGAFQLLRQTSRWARFARVRVQVTPADHTGVEVGPDPFGWRRPLYGPEAWACGYDDDLRAEAVSGVRYAWERLAGPDRPQVLVVITEIVERAADTGPGDVRFAAAHALWEAVGVEPSVRPYLAEDGPPVFPE